MFKFCAKLVAVAAMAGFVTASASAAPATVLKEGLATPVQSQATKVHGWHRYCAWGPVRYHRHVPGIGNVACYGRYWHNRWRSHYRWGSGGWGPGWGWGSGGLGYRHHWRGHRHWRGHHRWHR